MRRRLIRGVRLATASGSLQQQQGHLRFAPGAPIAAASLSTALTAPHSATSAPPLHRAATKNLPGSTLSIPAASAPSAAYAYLVDSGKVDRDEQQVAALRTLDELYHRLLKRSAPPPPTATTVGGGLWDALFGGGSRSSAASHRSDNTTTSPCGVYLYGGTGSGKTFLMDIFYTCLDVEAKRRVHFHAFMLDVHARLHAIRSTGHRGDPIPVLASEMGAGLRVMCFDEMQVTDVGDALILRRLFDGLFSYGLVVVATSNRPPRDLYANGLQRELFMPFIHALEERCTVVKLDSPVDYRLQMHAQRSRNIGAMGAAGRSHHSAESASAVAVHLSTAATAFNGASGVSAAGVPSAVDTHDVDQGSAAAPAAAAAAVATTDSLSCGPPDSDTVWYCERRPVLPHAPHSASVAHGVVSTGNRTSGSGSLEIVSPAAAGAFEARWLSVAGAHSTGGAVATSSSSAAAAASELPGMAASESSVTLETNQGRQLHVHRAVKRGTSAAAVRFTFSELCGAPLYAADYAAIAQAFPIVFLEGVPVLTLSERNEVRRFITLVDVLYEHRVQLVVSAAVEPWSTFIPSFRGDPVVTASTANASCTTSSARAGNGNGRFITAAAAAASRRGGGISAAATGGGGAGGGDPSASAITPVASSSSSSATTQSATAAPPSQYDEVFAFDRTVSRLMEMGSPDWRLRGAWEGVRTHTVDDDASP